MNKFFSKFTRYHYKSLDFVIKMEKNLLDVYNTSNLFFLKKQFYNIIPYNIKH